MLAGELALPQGCIAQLDQNTAHISAKQTLPLGWHVVTLTPWPLCAAVSDGVCFGGRRLSAGTVGAKGKEQQGADTVVEGRVGN